MPSLQDIRRRILSIKNTRQITSAMKLVAGAKLRRATENVEAARPYQEDLARVLHRVASGAADLEEPLFQVRAEVKTLDVLLFTSDRGLCGSFNSGLLRSCEHWVRQQERQGRTVRIRAYGKRGRDHFRKRGYSVVEQHEGVHASEFVDLARDAATRARLAFLAGEVDEVHLFYNRFYSVITQRPVSSLLLPVALQVDDSGEDAGQGPTGVAEHLDFDYEPAGDQILSALLPLFLQTVVLQALLENEAGQHGARMTAMDSATRNATELIDGLTLDYNRARQAAITKELIEIVSGADAL